MAIISDEKLKEIFEKVFGLNCYDLERQTFIEVDKTTGKPFSYEQKYMVLMLLKLANTEEGSHILSQLSLDQPVDLIIDPSQKESKYGWSAGHTVAITDIDLDINLNVSTLLHELTHEVQDQSGSNELELATEQDRFMVNKMREAEARLETAIVFVEICFNQFRVDSKISIPKGADSQLLKDCNQYMTLKNMGMTPEEIRETMLKSFFQDESWNADYNMQATRFAYSKYDRTRASFRHGKPAEEVMAVFMERNGLSKEAGGYFLNPDNISYYPKDEILAKSTKEHQGADGNLVEIYEGGVLVCQEIRNDEGKVLRSFRYGKDGLAMESKDYDLNGDLKSKTAYLDKGWVSAVYNHGKLEYEVYYGDKNEILGVQNALGERVAGGFSLESIRKKGFELCRDINVAKKQNKPVKMENFTEKAEAVLHDTYALFSATVVKTVAEEVLRQNEALKRGKLQISAEDAEKLQRLAADIKEMAPEATLQMEQKIVRESKMAPVQEDKQLTEKVEISERTATKPNEQIEDVVKPGEKTGEAPAVEKEQSQAVQGAGVRGKVFVGLSPEVEKFTSRAAFVIKNVDGDFPPNAIENVAKSVLKWGKEAKEGQLLLSAEDIQALVALADDVRQRMPELAQKMDMEFGQQPQQAAEQPTAKAAEASVSEPAPAVEPTAKAAEAEVETAEDVEARINQYTKGMRFWEDVFWSESMGGTPVVENFAQNAEVIIKNDSLGFSPEVVECIAKAVLKRDKQVKDGQLQVSAEEAQALAALAGDVRQKMPELAQKMDAKLERQSRLAKISEGKDLYALGLDVWGKAFMAESFGVPLEVENFAQKAEIVIYNDEAKFVPEQIDVVARAVLKQDKLVREGQLQVSAEEAQALAALAGDVRQKMPELAQKMDVELGQQPQQAAEQPTAKTAEASVSEPAPAVEPTAKTAEASVSEPVPVVEPTAKTAEASVSEPAPAVEPTVKAAEASVSEPAPVVEPTAKAAEASVSEPAPVVEPTVKAAEASVSEPAPAVEPTAKADVKDKAIESNNHLNPQAKNQAENRSSEEAILDTLLEKGNLTKAQENKLIEIATEIEHNRVHSQGKSNFAEQMIDKIAQNDIFTEKQKSIALDAAIVQEKKENKQLNPNMMLMVKQARMMR